MRNNSNKIYHNSNINNNQNNMIPINNLSNMHNLSSMNSSNNSNTLPLHNPSHNQNFNFNLGIGFNYMQSSMPNFMPYSNNNYMWNNPGDMSRMNSSNNLVSSFPSFINNSVISNMSGGSNTNPQFEYSNNGSIANISNISGISNTPKMNNMSNISMSSTSHFNPNITNGNLNQIENENSANLSNSINFNNQNS